MIYRLSSHIIIGKFQFTNVCGVEINESVETLTDTCTITLPKRIIWQGKPVVWGDKPILKRGDYVEVKLGYNEKLYTRFQGYIREVKSGVPMQIICEDSMFNLKKGELTKSYSTVKLSNLLAEIAPNVSVKSAEINLGTLRINKATPAQILQQLKDKYGIYSYFRTINDSPILYSGLKFWGDNVKRYKYLWNENIIDNNLIFRKEEDTKLKVKATSINDNNTKIEVEVGDKEGELRSVWRYNISQSDLKKFAEEELKRFKYTGYSGSFSTFGVDCVHKGDTCEIQSDRDTPSGIYLIESVRVQFNSSGFRQEIQLAEVFK